MSIKVSAGEFEIKCSESGYPHWITITSKTHIDQEISGIHHEDLADLEYCIKRMREKLRAHSLRP